MDRFVHRAIVFLHSSDGINLIQFNTQSELVPPCVTHNHNEVILKNLKMKLKKLAKTVRSFMPYCKDQ